MSINIKNGMTGQEFQNEMNKCIFIDEISNQSIPNLNIDNVLVNEGDIDRTQYTGTILNFNRPLYTLISGSKDSNINIPDKIKRIGIFLQDSYILNLFLPNGEDIYLFISEEEVSENKIPRKKVSIYQDKILKGTITLNFCSYPFLLYDQKRDKYIYDYGESVYVVCFT